MTTPGKDIKIHHHSDTVPQHCPYACDAGLGLQVKGLHNRVNFSCKINNVISSQCEVHTRLHIHLHAQVWIARFVDVDINRGHQRVVTKIHDQGLIMVHAFQSPMTRWYFCCLLLVLFVMKAGVSPVALTSTGFKYALDLLGGDTTMVSRHYKVLFGLA